MTHKSQTKEQHGSFGGDSPVEVVDVDKPDGPQERSAGHMGYQVTDSGTMEIYESDGNVYRAPLSNVFDVVTRTRQGRWQATLGHWNNFGPDVLIGEGFTATQD